MAVLARSGSAILLVVCGAINALLSKIVYQLEAPDCSGTVKPFEKPWLQTALMFMAMALCLPIAWLQHWWKARRHTPESDPAEHHMDQGHDIEAQGPASAADAATAVLKAAAINALAAASTAGTGPKPRSADAPMGSAAPSHGANDLLQPLLSGQQQQRPDQHRQFHGDQYAGGFEEGGQTRRPGTGKKMSRFHEALLLCVPTGFDLAATTLMNIGLLYVAASVFQILRGGEMIFAALFAVTFLHRPLNRWHYLGVTLCMAGIAAVGASRILAGVSSGVDASLTAADLAWDCAPDGLHVAGSGSNPSVLCSAWRALASIGAGSAGDARGSGSSSVVRQLQGGIGVTGGGGAGGAAEGDGKMALLGMGLILLSQAIQAGQVTLEDHFMSDMDMQPLLVVGWEGVIGSVVMLAGALSLLQHLPYRDGSGFAEDTVGSWCMIRASPQIAGALGLSTFAVLLYNIFGMYVTGSIGAAARVVLENARTLLVWLAALALYYTHVGGGKVGEPWDNWSWLQALGFGIFAAGAFLYNKGHQQQEEEEAAAGEQPRYSQWAVLKSTLSINSGRRTRRRFRAVGAAVLAGVRAGRQSDRLAAAAEANEEH